MHDFFSWLITKLFCCRFKHFIGAPVYFNLRDPRHWYWNTLAGYHIGRIDYEGHDAQRYTLNRLKWVTWLGIWANNHRITTAIVAFFDVCTLVKVNDSLLPEGKGRPGPCLRRWHLALPHNRHQRWSGPRWDRKWQCLSWTSCTLPFRHLII